MANGFGMKVVAYDPYLEDSSFQEAQAERVSLEECLRASDVISLHVPYTRETRRMINSNTLECIHDGAILVNTSRGGIVDEDSLMQALRDKEIGAVGLDVFEREPMDQNHSLMQFPQVVVTPHIGARTQEAFDVASETAARELVKVLGGSDFTHPLPPKAEWYSSPSTLAF
jgi:D-3-phosphoglycerate dehydrogenase